MKNITTYVGVDAHKKDLFVAMLVGEAESRVHHSHVIDLDQCAPPPLQANFISRT